jgi:heme oxygenase
MLRGFDRLEQELRRSFPLEDDLAPWLDADIGSAYSAILVRVHGFVMPLERTLELAPRLDSIVDLKKRRKAHLLWNDLMSLGMPAARKPRLTCPIPHLAGTRTALGWMLALERPTLSHDVIFRRLAGVIPGAIAFAASFLKCYLGEAGLRWRELGGVVDEAMSTPEAGDQILGAANDAFECRRRWLLDKRDERVAAVAT